ncbi:unnamed protein product [Alopecurus aequalis]
MDKIGVCNVLKWVEFVDKMTPAKRCKLAEAGLECMLDMKSIRLRKSIITLMIKAFHPDTETLLIQKNQPAITLKGLDVEALLGLKDKADGLVIADIIYEEGEYARNEIPPQFLSNSSGNLKIDDLIADALKSKVADDDFLRRAVFVLLGTVLAPQSLITVPREYYCVVKDVKRMKKMDFNGFTRTFLIENFKKLGTGYEMTQWPYGNLALAQKLLTLLNTKGVVYRHDKDNMSDNNEDHDVDKKEGIASTPSHGLQPKDFQDCSVDSEVSESSMDAGKSADDHESKFVTPLEKKKMYGTDADQYITPAGKQGATPEAPIIIDDSVVMPPKSSNHVDVISLTNGDAASQEFDSFNIICRKAKEIGKKEEKKEDECGKRKRKLPLKFRSPAVVKCPKRTKGPVRRVLSHSFINEDKTEGSNPLTPEIIGAVVQHVRNACKARKQYGTPVYRNANGLTVSAEFVRVIIDKEWLCAGVIEAYLGDLRIKMGDRTLCPAWRANALVETPPARRQWKKKTTDNTAKVEMSACHERCMEEYFATNKAYFTVNISKVHWVTVVMHVGKQEFQVLDSLWPLKRSKGFVQKLRAEIAKDVEFANKELSEKKYPDVSEWQIVKRAIPQQGDGHSCGLFVLECMEHWDGDRMTGKVSQKLVDDKREQTVAEIVMAQSNLDEKTKKVVLDIAARARA